MTTAHAITLPNGKVRYMIGSKFASKANYDAFIYDVLVAREAAKPVVKPVPPRKSPRATIDRQPKFIIRMNADEHSLEYNGTAFDMSGLALKQAAIIRYNVITGIFGKPSADKMVENYAKAAE